MIRLLYFATAIALAMPATNCFVPLHAAEGARMLTLHARQREADQQGTVRVVEKQLDWNPKETAIIVCDMWDKHWCQGATRRVAEMAPRMNEVLKAARQRGALIIHCPSDCMKFYENTPQRKRALQAPSIPVEVPLLGSVPRIPEREPELPVDSSDGGCDCLPQCVRGKRWTRQIKTLEIAPEDALADSLEAFYLMKQRGIKNAIVMGVHTNMCVLHRPFAIRQLVKQGQNVVLMRDMTDTMYNSRKPPYVNHFTGNDLVVEHIEQYWCPTITSTSLLGGEEFCFAEDRRKHLAIVMAENEYGTDRSLPKFAKQHLGKDFRVSLVYADATDRNNISGIEVLDKADAAIFSIRRRTPPVAQLAAVHRFIEAGKPLVALRTSSHAFSIHGEQPPKGHAAWEDFGKEVIGCNYHGHYSNHAKGKEQTHVWTVPAAKEHPILTGVVGGERVVPSGLYKNHPLVKSATPLLMGRFGDAKPHEPVAWTNETKWKGKVFYAALGSSEEIADANIARMLTNAIYWATDQEVPAPERETVKPAEGRLSPQDSSKMFHVPDDLQWEQVLSEPLVKQPVSICFDERGRLWVVQYQQYPHPAGLKIVSRDNYWRAVYDKVPQAPPNHFPGKDKITIHEDTNGDGRYDKHKSFVEGLNIVTACAPGRGGVYVLNPPYLLFYPDKNRDDVPDDDPEVCLSGFGLEDTHSTVNSLRFGPDGWLYAAQGSTVTGKVMRPGADEQPVRTMGQLIWRYHPELRRYEVFAEGGGNSYGVEIDSKGRIFSGHNGGNTRGFHYMQGGYYRKGFSKHGPLSNPFAFGFFEAMPHHDVPRFSHTFLIYESADLPESYRGMLYGVEPLQGQVVRSSIEPRGSSFQTKDIDRVVRSDDSWFRPVDIKEGPLGAIYVADWYDSQVNHYRNHEGKIDPGSGRIYRLSARDAKPKRLPDMAALSSPELVRLLASDRRWTRQTALRLLGDRRDAAMIKPIRRQLRTATGQTALELLWALHACGGLDESTAGELLAHGDPYVRLWTIRLMCDDREVSPGLLTKIVDLAKREQNLEVRNQLACSARRLPAKDCLALVLPLLSHDEDKHDLHQPQLLWWAIESKAADHRAAILAIFADEAAWNLPIVKLHLVERLMRRFAATGARSDLVTCAKLLDLAPNDEARASLLRGFEAAYEGRSLAALPRELIDALRAAGGGSLVLRVRGGDEAAIRQALAIVADESDELPRRVQLVEAFGEVRSPQAVPVLLKLISGKQQIELQGRVLTALGAYGDAKIGVEIVKQFTQLPGETREIAQGVLAGRRDWSHQLLDAVESRQIPKREIGTAALRKIQLLNDDELNQRINRLYGDLVGTTTDEMKQQVERLQGVIDTGTGSPYRGKELFTNKCAKCHALFDDGGEVGPDLTAFKRDEVAGMLLAVVNPSAEIREGYQNYVVYSKDGRTLTGFIGDRDARVIEVRGANTTRVTIQREEVDEMQPLEASVMPEGLLNDLSDQEVRDLFAYLRSSQPLNN